jgi:serine/threonine-protein kinase
MDEVLAHLRSELAGRYEVEHEIGRGGMAVVYLAHDVRHQRRVALKVLRTDVGVAGASERFLREIQTAAQLHHPHILPLYDSGTAGEHLFYVMPYVEGETVRERLERAGPLPVDEAIRLTREVADALEFAHERGIVHRDIKPENIFLSAVHAAVGDFGIARAADAAGIRLTETGMAVGTPAYMSPEQATADPKVDGRSDQYALACVLYEMLAGQPPFTGPTSQSIMARHTTDPVPPLTTVRAVPVALETVVRKALAKVPADRWPSARAFADSLERAVPGRASDEVASVASVTRRTWTRAGVAAAVAIVVAVLGWRALAGSGDSANPAAIAAEPVRSVAVLPFAFKGDTAHALIADGLTEGLITGLVRVEGLRVPASSRVMAFREKLSDPREVGRELQVGSVVSATVQVIANKLRVTAQLIDVGDGRLLWRQNFDGALLVNGKLADLFAIQDEFAAQIVEALKPQLGVSSRTTVARGVRTRDLEAYGLYQQARQATVVRTPENWRRAVDLLKQAIERDSTFADAWVLLNVATVSHLLSSGRRPSEALAATHGMLDRAIRLDSLNAGAYAIRSARRQNFEWNWEGAWQDIQHAVRLSPSDPSVLTDYGRALLEKGQTDSALHYARRALALESTNPEAIGELGFVSYFAGAPDSALVWSRRALERDKDIWTMYFIPMFANLDLGRRAAADSAADKFLRLGGYCCTQSLSYASVYYRRSGNRVKAQEMLDSMNAHAAREYVGGSEMATARLGVGDRAGALDALERGLREHDVMLGNNLWFTLGPLRGEPRYEAVRRKVYGSWPTPKSAFPN